MKVYVVTAGEYSDYSIQHIFSNREAADEYVRDFNLAGSYRDARVEEWEVDRTSPRFGKLYRALWRETLDERGVEVWNHEEHAPIPPGGIVVTEHLHEYVGWVISAVGEDVTRVVKAVAERRARYLARETG